MTQMRQRPSELDIDAWVAQARPHVVARATSRRWWRRLSRPTVALGVAGMVAAGGIAYAAVERTRPSEPLPEIRRGSSVVEIGRPGPGDKWLNVSVTYRCKKGERILVRDETHELMSGDCLEDSTEVGVTSRGVSGSRRADEIHGTQLTVTTDISREYRVDATWGPRASMPMARAMPSVGPDGTANWDVPTYPVNEYGLTVGNRVTVNTPESAWPDLMPTTYKGHEAYFRTKDSLGQMAGTPEEAVREMRERKQQGLNVDGKLYQFVYAADGRTRLGKKYVGSTSSK